MKSGIESTLHSLLTLSSTNITSGLENQCSDSAGVREVSCYADVHGLLLEFEEAILDADLNTGLLAKCENSFLLSCSPC